MRKNTPITEATFEAIVAALVAKGLDPEKVPADYAESQSLKSRDLSDLKEAQGQTLLTWLEQIPDDAVATEDQPADDQPADPAAAADTEAAPEETQDEPPAVGTIRKAEDTLAIKRPKTAAECQESLEELYELEGRRSVAEMEMEGYKGRANACKKEIESIDVSTYRIIRTIKENEIEERVPALRVTNTAEGMIRWYHRDTGELLREKAIEPGEQIPLDLAGDANGTVVETVKQTCVNCGLRCNEVGCPGGPGGDCEHCDTCAHLGDDEGGCQGLETEEACEKWEPIPSDEEATPPAETAGQEPEGAPA